MSDTWKIAEVALRSPPRRSTGGRALALDELTLDECDGNTELRARLSGPRLPPQGLPVWFRFPVRFRPPELDASPFVPPLLLLAMWWRTDLHVEGPVSPRLIATVARAKAVLRSWHPELADVPVSVAEERAPAPSAEATGCFFTGGVDSWYSVLQSVEGAPEPADPPLRWLVYRPTADFAEFRNPRAWNPDYVRRVREPEIERARAGAARTGCELAVVDTNVRAVLEPHRGWGYSHGSILSGAGLAIGQGVSRLLIGSTVPLGRLVSLGSHPLLDPLWSTERTEIVHHGAGASRTQKLRFLAERPIALERLKVCTRPGEKNCGRCSKCTRTMVGLHIAGALSSCPAFEAPLRPGRVASQVPATKLERRFASDLIAEFERTGGDPLLYAALQLGLIRDYLRRARRRTQTVLRTALAGLPVERAARLDPLPRRERVTRGRSTPSR